MLAQAIETNLSKPHRINCPSLVIEKDFEAASSLQAAMPGLALQTLVKLVCPFNAGAHDLSSAVGDLTIRNPGSASIIEAFQRGDDYRSDDNSWFADRYMTPITLPQSISLT